MEPQIETLLKDTDAYRAFKAAWVTGRVLAARSCITSDADRVKLHNIGYRLQQYFGHLLTTLILHGAHAHNYEILHTEGLEVGEPPLLPGTSEYKDRQKSNNGGNSIQHRSVFYIRNDFHQPID